MRLPESSNVYSTVFPPVDLQLLKRLLREEFPNAKVWTRVSGYNGATTLHAESEAVEFEGCPAADDTNPTYLLSGGLAGSDAEVVTKVTSVFRRFENAGVQMAIEAYDSKGELICSFPRKTAVPK